MKKKPNKKLDNAKLAKGAAKIRKLRKEKNGKGKKAKKVTAPPLDPVVIPESTRDIKEILAERVTVLPGSIGLRIADNTPIEESLRVLDWTTTLASHVGFMIGDVLLFSDAKWGEMYKAAINQTGRAYSTLQKYKNVAHSIPPERRIAALTFSHHKGIVPLEEQKRWEVLKQLQDAADKGQLPTKDELRHKVQKLTPRKKKEPKRTTTGKVSKRKSKPEPPPYEPSAEEQAKLDSVEDKALEFQSRQRNALLQI